MPASNNENAPERLSEEILADARRECEVILGRARQEADGILANARTQAVTIRQEKLDHARADAQRRSELLLATVAVEVELMRLHRVEWLLDSLRDEVRRRLDTRSGFDPAETLPGLAAEPIRRMSGTAFVLKLSPIDHAAFGENLAATVAERAGKPSVSLTLERKSALIEGGVVIEDTAGTQVWDNRLPARLARLWPELRRQIAVQTSLLNAGTAAGGES